jgi:predicted DCC family thiol-disulfide oxidoreductase YuxK
MTADARRFPVVEFVLAGESSDCGGQGRPFTLVYDGNCNVCGRFVRLIERWDRRSEVETIPSQHRCVAARFPWIPSEAYAEAVQLIGPGGRTSQGAEAIEDLLRILPRGWLIGWVFKVPLIGRLADKLYRWFARNRYRFGCDTHCQNRPPRLDYDAP